MAVSIARGLSGAGDAVARTLSGAGLNVLSNHGSASYDRLVDEAGGPDMPVSLHLNSPTEGRGGRSRFGPDQPPQQQQQDSLPTPRRFFLPGGSGAMGAGGPAAGSLSGATTSGLAAARPPLLQQQQAPSMAVGLGMPSPGRAVLLGVAPLHPGDVLPRPPGLARIRTRPREHSLGQQDGQLEAGMHMPGMAPGKAPAGLQAVDGGVDAAAGSAGQTAGMGEGGGSSRAWRTREQYQADLLASSSPISVLRSQQQRARDSSSEPGVPAVRRVRGQAGLNFVQTPTTNDATNRYAWLCGFMLSLHGVCLTGMCPAWYTGKQLQHPRWEHSCIDSHLVSTAWHCAPCCLPCGPEQCVQCPAWLAVARPQGMSLFDEAHDAVALQECD